MPNTGLAGTEMHSAHDARTVLIKISFMIKELLDWVFLCSPDMELPLKRIKNQRFSHYSGWQHKKNWNIVTMLAQNAIPLTQEMLGSYKTEVDNNLFSIKELNSALQQSGIKEILMQPTLKFCHNPPNIFFSI